MSLIDELKLKSEKASDARQEVIKEIKSYFDEFFDSDKFEDYLRNISDDAIAKREVCMYVYYDCSYNSSAAYFGCGVGSIFSRFRWSNPEGGWSEGYKGIKFKDFENDIFDYLVMRIKQKMNELGFHYLRKDRTRDWAREVFEEHYFGW